MAATASKVVPRNASGIEPLEYKVVVRPKIENVDVIRNEKTGFQLIKPIETAERDKHAAMEGTLIASSPTAFTYEENVTVPPIGATVIFARYSGVTVTGADGVEYRIMNDKDVVGVRS
jgi:co-chaperonin GroES (HSP10)